MFHPNYPYEYIIVTCDNVIDAQYIIDSYSSMGYYIHEDTIKAMGLKLKDGPIYTRISWFQDEFGWSRLEYLETFSRESYDELYTVTDLKRGLIDQIKKNGKYVKEPSYKPKNIIRELFSWGDDFKPFHKNYEYPYIIVSFFTSKDVDDFVNNVFDKFELVCNAQKHSFMRDVYILKNYIEDGKPVYVDLSIYNGNIYYGYDELSRINNYPDIQNKYEKVFTVQDLESGILDNILKFGTSIKYPSYKPKKIERNFENKLNEVCDNIHLSEDEVLNYYDDEAYAFLFFEGYDKKCFIIEQGMMHMNMIGNYLHKIGDKEYMDVYHTKQHDDFLLDIVDRSEYKGRVWIRHNIIAFWDISCNEQDKLVLKDILKRLENKFNIKIDYNKWEIEFFDIERQKMFFVTLDKFFNGELEDNGTKMTTSYYEYLKKKHLDSSTKKPVPYGYGSKNPKYKSLEYRQLLYQESLSKNTKVPNYKPKQIVRENSNYSLIKPRKNYNYICIEAKSSEEIVNIQKELFKNGFQWCLNNKRHVILYADKSSEIFSVKSNNEIYTSDNIAGFNHGVSNLGFCPVLFKYKDLDIYLKYLKYGLITPNYSPKKIIRENLITEDCDFVKLPNGDRLRYNNSDAYPFMYVDDSDIMIGKQSGIHADMLQDYLYKIGEYSEDNMKDYYYDNCYFKGRYWLNHKIISFWGFISSYDLRNVIRDLSKHIDMNLDEWSIDYAESSYTEYGDERKLMNIKDYMDSNFSEHSNRNKFVDAEERELMYESKVYTQSQLIDLYGFDAIIIDVHNNKTLMRNVIDFFNNSKMFFNNSVLSTSEDAYHYVVTFIMNPGWSNYEINSLSIASDDPDFVNNGDLQGYCTRSKFSDILSVKDAILLLSSMEKGEIVEKFIKRKIINPSVLYTPKKIVRENFENTKIITKFDELNNYNMYRDRNRNILTERIEAKKMDVPDDVLLFHHIFTSKGHKLYLVGGCVRDYLMGIKPHDFDMVTDAQPTEVVDILKDFRTDIHGAHFGVVRVYTPTEPLGYEIATYRKDISKGRNTKGTDQKVEIGKHITIKDDVRRRDLTVNALFYNIGNGEIIDVVGGVSDLRNNIIKAVGEPQRRFDEDRLRILRTIRFAAVTGGKIDKGTSDAIKKDSRLFGISEEDDVSRERIFAEFLKVKEKTRSNNDPKILTRFINLLIDYDIMQQIFPVLVTEKDIVPTSYLTVALAQTLRSNTIDNNFKETLVEAKIPGKYVDIISILILILKNGVDVENVYGLYRTLKSNDVRTDILREWIRVMSIHDKKVIALLKYEPSTSGQDVMKDGFKGAGIGQEISKRESIKFQELLDGMNESKILTTFEDFKNIK